MIFTESTIKISNNSAKMDSTIVLYRGDKNIEIRFTILQSPFKYSNTVATNVIESTNASYGQLVIKTPNDKPPIFSDVSATKEGTVLFTITKEMIDEIEEVGVYTFQIRLLDENKQSRVTIPPVENGIEIKEPIAIEDDNTTNVVGLAKANYAVATLSDVDTPAFDDNGKYNKTIWNDGDIITNASLNKIEDGIYTTNTNVPHINSETALVNITVDQLNKAWAECQANHNDTSIYVEFPNFTIKNDSLLFIEINNKRYRLDTVYTSDITEHNKTSIGMEFYSIHDVDNNIDGGDIQTYNDKEYNYSENKAILLLNRVDDNKPPIFTSGIKLFEISINKINTLLLGKDVEFYNSLSIQRNPNSKIGEYSTAIGNWTEAPGGCSHAEGSITIASAYSSHAEGMGSKSLSSYAHAEGYCTTASGSGSHAEGSKTKTSGENSHAEGTGTTASCRNQHVQGQYNIEDKANKYAHIVGNGTDENKRSNAHTLDWKGNAWYSGKITAGAAPVEDMDLTTKKYVDDNKIAYTVSSKVLATIPASDIKIDESITVSNVSINKDRRYYIEFLGSKKLCSLSVDEEIGNAITCSINNYTIEVFNDSSNISTRVSKINRDDTTATTFTNLVIYEEEVKYLDNKYLETDLTLQNSISLGRIGDIGTGSSAIGYDVEASGNFSHAEGNGAKASGNYGSHAEGDNTESSGESSHAEGVNTIASGNHSHAEGNNTKASGMSSHTEGDSTTASGDYSHAEGNTAIASGLCSHAEGHSTKASGTSSHAEGGGTEASNANSHAEGDSTVASGQNSHAEGDSTKALGESSHSEGTNTTASGDFSHAEGGGTTASSMCSHAEGSNTIASSENQHVQGVYNIEDKANKYAHIVGNGKNDESTNWKEVRSNAHTLDWQGNAWYAGQVEANNLPYTISSKVLATVPASNIKLDNEITINNVSIKEDRRYYIEFLGSKKLCSLLTTKEQGNGIICNIGNYAIQVVTNSTNISLFIIKINEDDTTTDTFTDLVIYEEEIKCLDSKYLESDLVLQNSISLGRIGKIGGGSSAIGMGVTASGDGSHAEGSTTKASGLCSHAEGESTKAIGDFSHSEGDSTKASGTSSHAEGDSTTASSNYSHSEGNGTTASGTSSHAEGDSTIASGFSSHVEGYNTVASAGCSHAEGDSTKASSENQHVQGKYNIEDTANKYAHIVGNGDEDTESNAHTLDWQGNAWFAGKLSQEGTPTENKDLVTKKYVDDKISSLPQFSFNEAGELVVTINGVSKTFVPKNV